VEQGGGCGAERKKEGLGEERDDSEQVVLLAGDHIAVIWGWAKTGEETWAEGMWTWVETEQDQSPFDVRINVVDIMHFCLGCSEKSSVLVRTMLLIPLRRTAEKLRF
jgi:hypothetical protein